MGAGESPAPDRLLAATATAVTLANALNAQSAVVLDYGTQRVQPYTIHQGVSLRICESVCSGTRSCSGAYIDVLRHRRSVDILPALASVALLRKVCSHEFDCLGVAVCCVLGSLVARFRRLIHAECEREQAYECCTSETGTQSDACRRHAATAAVIAAVTAVVVAEIASGAGGVPHREVAGCKIITFHFPLSFLPSDRFGRCDGRFMTAIQRSGEVMPCERSYLSVICDLFESYLTTLSRLLRRMLSKIAPPRCRRLSKFARM
nr:MAG TPA: hypothetical protein [Caudoviricetes sp.]